MMLAAASATCRETRIVSSFFVKRCPKSLARVYAIPRLAANGFRGRR